MRTQLILIGSLLALGLSLAATPCHSAAGDPGTQSPLPPVSDTRKKCIAECIAHAKRCLQNPPTTEANCTKREEMCLTDLCASIK